VEFLAVDRGSLRAGFKHLPRAMPPVRSERISNTISDRRMGGAWHHKAGTADGPLIVLFERDRVLHANCGDYRKAVRPLRRNPGARVWTALLQRATASVRTVPAAKRG